MKIKTIFGSVLTILGTAGLIYVAIIFVNSSNEPHNLKALLVYGIISLIFFISGISLVRTT